MTHLIGHEINLAIQDQCFLKKMKYTWILKFAYI